MLSFPKQLARMIVRIVGSTRSRGVELGASPARRSTSMTREARALAYGRQSSKVADIDALARPTSSPIASRPTTRCD